MVCTCYKAQITRIDSLLDCFVSTLNSSQTSLRIMAIQAVIISLSNLRLEIRALLPQIVSHLSTRLNNDTHVAQVMLEFLMREFNGSSDRIRLTLFRLVWILLDLLFDNASDDSMTPHLFRILIHMTHQSQHQTANNLLLAHTLLCFYFQRLSAPDRQLYAYCLLRVRWRPGEKQHPICSSLVIATNVTHAWSRSESNRATRTSATFRFLVIIKWW